MPRDWLRIAYTLALAYIIIRMRYIIFSSGLIILYVK